MTAIRMTLLFAALNVWGQIAGPLRVLRAVPEGSPDPTTEITVTFDRPVAGGLEETVSPASIFSIAPAVEGVVEWRDPITLRFTPATPLSPGASYTVTVAPIFEAMDGSRLERPYVFTFTVARARLLASEPVGEGRSPKHLTATPTFRLLMSSPVDARELAARVWVTMSRACGGATIRVEPVDQREPNDADPPAIRYMGQRPTRRGESGQELRRVVELKPVRPLPMDCEGVLVVPSEDSDRPAKVWQWPLRTHGPLELVAAACGTSAWCPTGPVRVEFSTPVRGADVLRRVKVVPDVAYTVRDTTQESATWLLDAPLAPRGHYAVLVDSALTDVFGQRLTGPIVRPFLTTGYPPSVSYDYGRLLVEREGLRTLAVQHVNVDTLDVSYAQVPDSLYADFLSRTWNWEQPWSALRASVVRTKVAVRGGRDQRQVTGVSLAGMTTAARGALFAVKISSPSLDSLTRANRPISLVQLTDLAVHARVGADEGVVWVTGVGDGRARANVLVTLRDPRTRIVAEARTDAQGLARLTSFRTYPNADGECDDGWCGGLEGYVTASLGEDRAVVGLNAWDPDLAPWRFGISGAWGEEREPAAVALFTERGIYRPGEAVYAKAIVRQGALGALTAPRGDSVKWVFNDRDGAAMRDTTIALSDFGTADERMALPADAPLGDYSIQLQSKRAGQWRNVGWASYRVAEYRPPEFLVDVMADDAPRFGGDTAAVNVSARYLFGAPMASSPVEWSVRMRSLSGWELSIPGADSWTVGMTTNWSDERDGGGTQVTSFGTDTLDATGNLEVRFPVTPSADGRAARATLQAVVTDANRQTAAAAKSFTVHPASFYLGLRAEGDGWFWTAGKPVTVGVIAVRPTGERVGDVRATGTVVRREWHRVRRTRDGQVEEVAGWVSDTVATCDVRVGTDAASCRFTPPGGGIYTVTLASRDEVGRPVASSITRWAGGKDWVPWNDETQLRMEVVPDRDRYSVGDTATVLFASPFTDAEAWVTVERERVLESRRMRITAGATTLKFPITEAFAPNAFVSIIVVRGRSAAPGPLDDPGRPTMRVGYAELRVLPEVKRLAVEVTPVGRTLAAGPVEYQPGDSARIRIAVRDRDSVGHRSEVTLWAVDEGVLALTGYRTPDPIDLLYRERGVGMRLASNLVSVAPQIPDGQKGGRSPGGGGGGELAGILRSRFQTTAFFIGSVITDDAGDAVASAKLPDNLTTFRVMAVAVTAGDRYGSGESELLVTRPLVARPSLPRFVRDGDRFSAGVVVNQRMGGTPKVEVAAKTEGIDIVGKKKIGERLAAGRGVEVRFDFRAKAGSGFDLTSGGIFAAPADSAHFRFDASADREKDAVALAVPIRPGFHPLATTIAGVLRDTSTAEFVLEGDVDPERSRIELSFGTSPFAIIGGVRKSLRVYPYYCTEQLSSTVLPLIALYRAERMSGRDAGIGNDAAAQIEMAVRLISRRQTADGSIGYWSAMDWSTPWLTSYAGRVLLEAKAAGVAVDSTVLAGIADYMSRSLRETTTPRVAVAWWYDGTDARLSERLAAVDFLSRHGRPDVPSENTLLQQSSRLRWEDRVLLAEVLARRRQVQLARSLLTSVWSTVRVEGRTVVLPAESRRSHYFASRVRPAARLLAATRAVDPANPLIGPLVETLIQQGRAEAARAWTTQDYGFTVLALMEYAAARQDDPPAAMRIRANGRTLISTSANGVVRDTSFSLRNIVTRDADGRPVVRVELDDGGDARGAPVFWYLTVREAPKGRQLDPIDRGITVERWYEDVATRKPIVTVAEGQLVRVRVRVTVPEERHFVVVDDPLPAGLEAVDLSLRTVSPLGPRFTDYDPAMEDPSGESSWWYGSWDSGLWSPFDHKELRDDRVVHSATVLWKGAHMATYLARATTAGTFVVPPAHAEAMYNPGVNGRTAGTDFTVTKVSK